MLSSRWKWGVAVSLNVVSSIYVLISLLSLLTTRGFSHLLAPGGASTQRVTSPLNVPPVFRLPGRALAGWLEIVGLEHVTPFQ
ncbi:hypothetical protein DFP72DRAFT_919695 [Ephemerocybe angulata]|uniref:Uncharacterized protein n=1 Tax=Ephemerocybe angulata TaxID=980116 RepID=A0A8H6HBL3_9AGAR|nr:hypothetical protein DFP72DRAFT_934590 [Tulosesus angulatus]KAF6747581.1 hypothetical protein DFP72DRAFT_919695 [Tulosesus angulatus]